MFFVVLFAMATALLVDILGWAGVDWPLAHTITETLVIVTFFAYIAHGFFRRYRGDPWDQAFGVDDESRAAISRSIFGR